MAACMRRGVGGGWEGLLAGGWTYEGLQRARWLGWPAATDGRWACMAYGPRRGACRGRSGGEET